MVQVRIMLKQSRKVLLFAALVLTVTRLSIAQSHENR
jgi:hypothetical protein